MVIAHSLVQQSIRVDAWREDQNNTLKTVPRCTNSPRLREKCTMNMAKGAMIDSVVAGIEPEVRHFYCSCGLMLELIERLCTRTTGDMLSVPSIYGIE